MNDNAIAPTILLVDSSSRSREEKQYGLTQRGYEVILVENNDHALNVLDAETIPIVISELHASGIDGMRLMHVALRKKADAGIILMTEPGSTELVVTAMKEGAYDVLEQPVYVEKLAAEIEKILERQKIVQENVDLQRQLEARYGFENIVGRSASIQRIREQILQIADTQSTVLIYGESGTGKELVAYALHSNSSRRNKSFVPVFCNALSEGVIESELFGHERGAFTNAVKLHKGRFELAHGGSLFLDEVGELTPATQVKLLRVLQERTFQRVGSTQWIKTDTRLIAATNRNLEEEVKNGHFREDLYYRLRVIPLTVPPLRERKEDLPLLIDRFIRRFSERENKQIEGIDHRALEWLSAYHWPGNVRQLENCIEGMIVMNTGLSTLTEDDVPEFVRHPTARRNAIHIPSGISHTKDSLAPELIRSLVMTVAEQRGEIISDITDEAVHHLSMVDWSRNGGALRRCIDMMVLLADHPVLEVQDIPSDYLPAIPPSETSTPNNQQEVGIQVGMSMEEAERRLIKTTLASCGHNKTHTARVLKIGLSTLFRKIKMYHLD